jgi:pimeloyl-ACP methyl ester carboxylesterase
MMLIDRPWRRPGAARYGPFHPELTTAMLASRNLLTRAAVVLATLLGACDNGTNIRGDIAATFAISPTRSMYIECRGNGSPTVVLVAGQRGSAADWTITASRMDPPQPAVFGEVARFTRVCAYDRPGTPVGESFSRSDPAPQPTTAAAATADLHALLQSAGESAPYVIAGHSAGGTVARLYASTWPDDVRGMVLVDALAEGLQDAMTPAQWVTQRILLQGDLTESLREYPDIERFDADVTFAQLRAAPPLRPLPLVVLSSDASIGQQVLDMAANGQLPAGVPADFGYVTESAQRVAQARLAALVPGARHVKDTNSGHNIHHEQPQLVVESIRDVVNAARAGRATLAP